MVVKLTMAAIALAAAAIIVDAGTERTAAPAVTLVHTPNSGIQPRAVVANGALHLIYYSGDPAHGDVWYTRSHDFGRSFSPAIRVNSGAGSAIAVGNIRGARIAAGRDGWIHVAWNGSQAAQPHTPDGKTPMLFARLKAGASHFERQRNVAQSASGLDGGGSVAADGSGNVYVFWHALARGGDNEAARRVWMAKSVDDGASFAPEKIAWDHAVGACGCCGLDAFADRSGAVYVLFRSAFQNVHRDMHLLLSEDHGASFAGTNISKWEVGYCVMSSESFAQAKNGVVAGWETSRQVYAGRVPSGSDAPAQVMTPPGETRGRRYPSVAVNQRGDVLLAWTEGMKWNNGGDVAWQVFDSDGNAAGPEGHAAGVRPWSLVAAVAAPDGSFRIIF